MRTAQVILGGVSATEPRPTCKDAEEAFHWPSRWPKHIANAMYRLGWMYERGEGVGNHSAWRHEAGIEGVARFHLIAAVQRR